MGGSSSPPPPPATQTTVQQATIPNELKPFITDILEEGQAVKDRRMEEGYVPFEGPRIAEFTPDQQEAFTGVRSLVGTGQQYFDPATRLTAASALAPTRTEEVQQYMSPYIQNVVDIETREAQRKSDVAKQQLASQAVDSGGYGSSREAILQAELQRNLLQQLGDIQAKGTAAAYEDAQRRMAEQRGRELSAGAQFSNLGVTAPGQAMKEFQGLEAVGAQKQAQQQQGLNIAQQEYEIARTFPERTLQDYSSIVRGFAAPIPASSTLNTQTTTPPPSFMQNASTLAGLGLTASKFLAGGGLVGLAPGGLIYGDDGSPNTPSLPRELSTVANQQGTPTPDISAQNLLQEQVRAIREQQAKEAAFAAKKKEILARKQEESQLDRGDLASLLLQYGAADPTKSFGEQISGPVKDLLDKQKKALSDKGDYELASESADIEAGKSSIVYGQQLLENSLALKKILASKDLSVSEATSLTKQYIDAVASDNIELIAKARASILAVPGAANNPQIMAIFKATENEVAQAGNTPPPRSDVAARVPPVKMTKTND
jgi:hypothetical protein